MGSQVFNVLSAGIMTVSVMVKFKMSHGKQNCMCAQINASARAARKRVMKD